MVEDHQKANKEVEQLASKEGVQLPMSLTGKHKDKKEKISQLSGKEFDRAYMTYMLRDHAKDVKEFERGAHALKNPQIRQWAEGTLPVLKQHLQKARQIASSIGIDRKPAR
jgi:putative membrane protein